MNAEPGGRGDIDRTLQLLWQPERDDRRRTLTVTAIVDTAITIANEHGLGAMSIRAVASELGVGAMSLYRYIPSKAVLLDLMIDRAQHLDDLPPGWQDAMATLGRHLWHLHATHRWLPFVDQSRPVLGPNAVHRLDLAMSALAETDLTDQEKVALIVTIDSFVTALARTENSVAAATVSTGLTHDDFWQAQEQTLTEAMASGAFPAMAALSEDTFAATSLDTLEFGLTAIINGVKARLDRGCAANDAAT